MIDGTDAEFLIKPLQEQRLIDPSRYREIRLLPIKERLENRYKAAFKLVKEDIISSIDALRITDEIEAEELGISQRPSDSTELRMAFDKTIALLEILLTLTNSEDKDLKTLMLLIGVIKYLLGETDIQLKDLCVSEVHPNSKTEQALSTLIGRFEDLLFIAEIGEKDIFAESAAKHYVNCLKTLVDIADLQEKK
jgi:hypothetical protein